MGKIIRSIFVFVFFCFLAVCESVFAFEVTANSPDEVPYSKYLEKYDSNGWTVVSEMSEEEQADAVQGIKEIIALAKDGNFTSEFEVSTNETIKIFENYTSIDYCIPLTYKKCYYFSSHAEFGWLDKVLTELGAVRYSGTAVQSCYYLKTGKNSQCFINVLGDAQGATELSFFNNFVANKISTVTLEKSDFDNGAEGKFVFCVNSLSGKARVVKVTINGEEDAAINLALNFGATYDSNYNRFEKDFRLEAKRSREFVLDGIPPVDGLMYFTASAEGSFESIKIEFSSGEDIPVIKFGAELGMIVLKGVDSSLGAKLVSYGSGISFDNNLNSTVVDDFGNYVFTVPAGFYKLEFANNPYADLDGRFFAQNIPVSAGEVTEVAVPVENQRIINELRKNLSYSDVEKAEGNININAVSVKNTEGTVEIVVDDPLKRDIFPEVKDITITENGVKGSVTKIEREPQPVDVVLVLDTSGSMGDNMKPATEAAKAFVNSLPDRAGIRLVQFAQKITVHKGTTKAEVSKALDGIKAIGATAMYDALDKALGLLKDKKKPYIVLFSDGADSREPGVDGKGSDLTKEQIRAKLEKSSVTLLTIGFGKGHDPKTLKSLSEATSNGMYVAAADKKALPSAFAAVSAKFGNQFKIGYKRPYTTKDAKSDVPVIGMMIDNSRSMDMDPEEMPDSDSGYRMDKVKNVFHNFINYLPSNSLMTLMTFTGGGGTQTAIHTNQILTNRKADILSALSECAGISGTPTNEALTFALENLRQVTSSKRLLIFFTDAGLDSEFGDEESLVVIYESLLKKFKTENIRVLFAGLGGKEYIEKYKAPFEKAARLSGGDYIITSDTEEIAKKLNELLKKVDEPVTTKKALTVSVALDSKTEDGSRMNYSAVNTYPELEALEKKGEIVKPSVISIKTGAKYALNIQERPVELCGSEGGKDNSRVLSNVVFEGKPSARNKFAVVEARELSLLKKFKGFEPERGLFAALKLKVSFKKANKSDSEVAYEIPSIFNHFYLSLNNSNLLPPSKLTWLSEKPITKQPEKVSISVDEKNSAEGYLIFDVPFSNDEAVDQLSLHCFDINNGNIELPIVGRLTKKLEEIKKLPSSEPEKLSDAFSVKIRGFDDKSDIENNDFMKNGSVLRVIEADFSSNLSALLDIKPVERFYYALETDNGMLMTKMSNIVHSMPLGFAGKQKFSPGYSNIVRMPFMVGKELVNAPSMIWGDVARGDVRCKVSTGKAWKGSQSLGKKFSHEYFDVVINDMGRLDGYGLLDVTIFDKADSEGLGTSGLTRLFSLDCKAAMPDNVEVEKGKTMIKAVSRRGLGNFGSADFVVPGRVEADSEYCEKLLYGIDDKWGVFDGQSRRGVIAFKLTGGYEESDDWEIISEYIPSVKIKLPKSEFANKSLLVKDTFFPFNNEREERIDAAVSLARARYDALYKDVDKTPAIGLSKSDKPETSVSVPSLTILGSERLAGIKTEKDIEKLFEGLRCYFSSSAFYSPEAVLTQKWGSEADLVKLAENLFSKIGFNVTRRTVMVTPKGAESLKNRLMGEYYDTKHIAIEYKKEGKTELFVPLFGKKLADLKGLCLFVHDTEPHIEPRNVTFSVSVYGKLTGDAGYGAQQAIAADLFGALGGSAESNEGEDGIREHTTLFSRSFPIETFTKDMFDVSFVKVGKSQNGKGNIVCAVVDSPEGVLMDKSLWIDTSCYELESVTIKCENIETRKILKPGQALTDLFITFSAHLPEISSEAGKSYESAIKVRAEGIKDSSNYTKLKWQGHAAISRFVRNFTKASNDVADKLGIEVKRINWEKSLGVAAICESKGEDATIELDLMNLGISDISNNNENFRSYNTVIGLVASQLEGAILPGGKGESYLNVWSSMANGGTIMAIDSEVRDQALEFLKEKKFPKLLIERVENKRDTSFIITTEPGLYNGEVRWAWLEYNDEDGRLISAFDNGCHSGMAGFVLGLTPANMCNFAGGVLIGIACSNFSVAAYTLEDSENYEAVFKAAEKLSMKIAGVLKGVESLASSKDIPSLLGNVGKNAAGEISTNVTGVDVVQVYEVYKIWKGDEKYIPTFSEGFEKAVNSYFGK